VTTDADGVNVEVELAAGTSPSPAGPVIDKVRARLVVAADGARSVVRRDAGISASDTDYDQVAVVANVTTDSPNDGTAYERFTPAGPLALIPLHDGSWTVVWAQRPAAAQASLNDPDADFLAGLQRNFGWRAGRFTRVGRRSAYPLVLTRADELIAPRTVLIGNAAQSLHPVAGQGLNLALRDVAALAELIARGDDPGAEDVLKTFARWRRSDRRGVIAFTDGLIHLFTDTRAPVSLARNAGLVLFDLLPPAKRALSRVSLGFGGRTPRLARGLKLT
jgi:2-octaprenyl-6-methoxyphenol hydroxylase